jgi:hypothetical protein
MSRLVRVFSVLVIAIGVACVAAPGCKDKPKEPEKKSEKKEEKEAKKGEHGDDEVGTHGGPVAEWKEGYHAEFIVDAGKKTTTIYILGDPPEKAPKVAPEKITEVELIILGEPQVKLALKHDPKESGDKGIAFVSPAHEKFAKPEGLKVNIHGMIDGKKYAGDVTYKAPKK